MKKVLGMLLLCVLLCAAMVCAASAATVGGNCGAGGDNVKWSFDFVTRELVISGTGAMTNYSSYSSVPWDGYRDSIKTVTIGDGVTSIGGYAFYNCRSLTSITVDENNTKYSSDAYGTLFNKDKTTLIQYPIGNARTEYMIPDSVTSIGSEAFEDCYLLTTVTIPDSVTSIGSSAFEDCSSLTTVTIPDSVTSIGTWAFGYCSSLTTVTIPDSVTSIGWYAFYDCSSLTTVTIPNSVTSIYSDAFYGCTNLTIYGYAGSYAESYAKKNDIPFVAGCAVHTFGEWTVTVAATCTAAGVKTHTCTVCGEAETTEIPALGHDYTILRLAKPATCTANGVAQYTCTRCGETKLDYVPALGHTEVEIPGVAATCTETGLTAGVKCSVCGEILTAQAVIPALGHTEVEISGVAATCTETGLTAGVKCSVCGEILTAQTIAPALGHDNVLTETYSEPTCTEEGIGEYTCSRCGTVALGYIPKTEHIVEAWTVTVPATSVAPGEEQGECTICHTTLTREIPAVTHGNVDGDGKTTIADALLTLRAVLNGRALDNADMNGDGKLSLIDVLLILKSISQ